MAGLLLSLSAWSIQRTFIAGLILGGIYYITIFDDGSALDQRIQQTVSEIKAEEGKQVESAKALREVEQVRATVGALSDQFKLASQQLPSELQMADVIRAVDTISRSTGVSVKAKEPKPLMQKDVIEEIPLRINLEGGYSEITSFIFYISSLERIMKVKNFTISFPQISGMKIGANPGPGPLKLAFDGQVISYRFIGAKKEDAKK